MWRHGKVLPSIVDLEEGGEGRGEGGGEEGREEGRRGGRRGGGEGGGEEGREEGRRGGRRGYLWLHPAAPQPTHLALELAVKCLPVDGRHPAQLGAVRPLEVIKLHAVRQ